MNLFSSIFSSAKLCKKLNGKTAVITGASRGIGAEIAREFARQGARVVLNHPTLEDDAAPVVEAIIAGGGRAMAIQADVRKKNEIETLFSEAVRAFGKIDILVNNAGVYDYVRLPQITEDHFHQHFDLNVIGLLMVTQEAVKHFSDQGGSIINMSSISSTIAGPGGMVYGASKAAVDAITRSVSHELGGRKIRVNSINPGVLEGGKSDATRDRILEVIKSRVPLGRLGTVEDVARAAVFLASAESDWITGETFYVTGGFR